MRLIPRDREGFVSQLEGCDGLRIFCYGSLMWKPECEVGEMRRVTVRGWHRALCIYSYRYRGNRKFPGLVLGLAKGGSCQGVSMRLCWEDKGVEERREDLRRLWEREMPLYVYQPMWLESRVACGKREDVLAFVARRDHRQYVKWLDGERRAWIVRHARGKGGDNMTYVKNALLVMRRLRIGDRLLAEVI